MLRLLMVCAPRLVRIQDKYGKLYLSWSFPCWCYCIHGGRHKLMPMHPLLVSLRVTRRACRKGQSSPPPHTRRHVIFLGPSLASPTAANGTLHSRPRTGQPHRSHHIMKLCKTPNEFTRASLQLIAARPETVCVESPLSSLPPS